MSKSYQIYKPTLEAISRAVNMASDDASRPHICGVDIKIETNGTVYIRATNGHALCNVKLKDALLRDSGLDKPLELFLSSELSKLFKGSVKDAPEFVSFTIEHGAVILAFPYQPFKIAAVADRNKYPNTDGLFTNSGMQPVFSLDADLLFKLVSSIADKKGKYAKRQVTFFIREESGDKHAVEIEMTRDGAVQRCVIMPMRDSQCKSIRQIQGEKVTA